jgi:hygromycin-B 4-O-kinase
MNVDFTQARAFLASYCGSEPTKVELIGEGAWSRCFGFRHQGQELVIRFGNHVDDFQKDRLAHIYSTPGLPIPEVLEIGRAFAGYYAISTRAHGIPLENVDANQWSALVPALVSALESMRVADLSAASGFGGWGERGEASHTRWSDHLLAMSGDTSNERIHGWRQRLSSSPEGEATFIWGFDLLKRVVRDSVPRSLLHCDLINRNVLVDESRITAVFDWGCSRYGDHLYDLAWFEFWAPWHPNLDIQHLRLALEQRWREVGYLPENLESRLLACYLHIGLDHLAYNAYLARWETLAATAQRMRTLAAGN